MADYCLNFGRKTATLRFLRTYVALNTVYIRLIRKLVVDFQLVLSEIFFARFHG